MNDTPPEPPSEPSVFELVCRQLGDGELPPLESIEKWYTLEVLHHMRGNRVHAARVLGIGANTLWRKLKRWCVPPARADAQSAAAVTEHNGQSDDASATRGQRCA